MSGRALIVIETSSDRAKAARWAQGVPVGTRIEFKETKRSLPQNDRLWAMLTDVQAFMKARGQDFTTDQWKCIFMHACGQEVSFIPSLDRKTFIPYGQSSSDLSKQEMTDLIEFIFAWGAENEVVFHDPKANDNPHPGADHVAGDESSDANPASSTDAIDTALSVASSIPDEADSNPAAASEEPSANPPPKATAADGSSLDSRQWLLNVARMLWAATNFNGDIDVLKNQKKAALVAFPKPEDCPKLIADKANSAYSVCDQVVNGSIEPGDGLALVAGIAMADQDDILKKAGL